MLRAVEQSDAIVVADYGRGLAANPELRALLAALADDIPIVWDPHPSGAVPVPGVAVATPNLAEAAKAAGTRRGHTCGNRRRRGALLLERWQSQGRAGDHGGAGRAAVGSAGPPAADHPGAAGRRQRSVRCRRQARGQPGRTPGRGPQPRRRRGTGHPRSGGLPRRRRSGLPAGQLRFRHAPSGRHPYGPARPCGSHGRTRTPWTWPGGCGPTAEPWWPPAAASTCCMPAMPAHWRRPGTSVTA